jgi:hypothetical protein
VVFQEEPGLMGGESNELVTDVTVWKASSLFIQITVTVSPPSVTVFITGLNGACEPEFEAPNIISTVGIC